MKTSPETVSSHLFFEWGLGVGKGSEPVEGVSHQPFFLAHSLCAWRNSLLSDCCHLLLIGISQKEITAINAENLTFHLEAFC